jgi:hypothetical protein
MTVTAITIDVPSKSDPLVLHIHLLTFILRFKISVVHHNFLVYFLEFTSGSSIHFIYLLDFLQLLFVFPAE